VIDLSGSINSLDFGPGATTGVHVVRVQGLRFDTAPLVASPQRVAADGVSMGTRRKGGRVVAFTFGIRGFDAAEFVTNLEAFVTATPQLAHTTIPLLVEGGDYSLDVFVDSRSAPIYTDHTQRIAEVDVVFSSEAAEWTAVP